MLPVALPAAAPATPSLTGPPSALLILLLSEQDVDLFPPPIVRRVGGLRGARSPGRRPCCGQFRRRRRLGELGVVVVVGTTSLVRRARQCVEVEGVRGVRCPCLFCV